MRIEELERRFDAETSQSMRFEQAKLHGNEQQMNECGFYYLYKNISVAAEWLILYFASATL